MGDNRNILFTRVIIKRIKLVITMSILFTTLFLLISRRFEYEL